MRRISAVFATFVLLATPLAAVPPASAAPLPGAVMINFYTEDELVHTEFVTRLAGPRCEPISHAVVGGYFTSITVLNTVGTPVWISPEQEERYTIDCNNAPSNPQYDDTGHDGAGGLPEWLEVQPAHVDSLSNQIATLDVSSRSDSYMYVFIPGGDPVDHCDRAGAYSDNRLFHVAVIACVTYTPIPNSDRRHLTFDIRGYSELWFLGWFPDNSHRFTWSCQLSGGPSFTESGDGYTGLVSSSADGLCSNPTVDLDRAAVGGLVFEFMYRNNDGQNENNQAIARGSLVLPAA